LVFASKSPTASGKKMRAPLRVEVHTAATALVFSTRSVQHESERGTAIDACRCTCANVPSDWYTAAQ
jgi:hypothetical protein